MQFLYIYSGKLQFIKPIFDLLSKLNRFIFHEVHQTNGIYYHWPHF